MKAREYKVEETRSIQGLSIKRTTGTENVNVRLIDGGHVKKRKEMELG